MAFAGAGHGLGKAVGAVTRIPAVQKAISKLAATKAGQIFTGLSNKVGNVINGIDDAYQKTALYKVEQKVLSCLGKPLRYAANGIDDGFSYISGKVSNAVQYGRTIVCGSTVNGGSNTTKLYRVMSEAEYQSVITNGKFVPYDMAMEEKWFATSADDAAKWANSFYPDGNYRMIEVHVDTNSLSQMYFSPKLDNIGPAYCSSLEVLENAIQTIKVVK